jgi:hypothetical protein
MAAVFQPLFIALGVAQYLDLLRRAEQPRSEAIAMRMLKSTVNA